MSNDTVFNCRRCGACCMGEGGIVLGSRDLARLMHHFDMQEDAFLAEYATLHNGKYKIRTGPDGNCLFFRAGKGCAVHEVKPDVCRAWPFFRGNMVDASSLDMAREFCPGIRQDATHEEFVEEGRAYLQKNGLQASNPVTDPVALVREEG